MNAIRPTEKKYLIRKQVGDGCKQKETIDKVQFIPSQRLYFVEHLSTEVTLSFGLWALGFGLFKLSEVFSLFPFTNPFKNLRSIAHMDLRLEHRSLVVLQGIDRTETNHRHQRQSVVRTEFRCPLPRAFPIPLRRTMDVI